MFLRALFVAILAVVPVLAHSSDSRPKCDDPSDPPRDSTLELADRLFHAYVDNEVKTYHVTYMRCGSEINYFFDATGKQAGFGKHWHVRINTDDQEATIVPGA